MWYIPLPSLDSAGADPRFFSRGNGSMDMFDHLRCTAGRRRPVLSEDFAFWSQLERGLSPQSAPSPLPPISRAKGHFHNNHFFLESIKQHRHNILFIINNYLFPVISICCMRADTCTKSGKLTESDIHN